MAEHRVSENSNVVIFVGRENTNRRKRVTLGIGADIIDLTDEIQNLFTLGADEDITLYLENEASGGIGKKVPAVGGLKEYAGQTMVFKVNELERTEMGCCDQNIILIGSPGHGKSSTINTIAKAFLIDAPIAQTFTQQGAGTTVFTQHKMEVGKSSFSLWDVPGDAMKGSKDDVKVILRNIFRGKEKENKKLGRNTAMLSSNSRKIHAVMCVQKGLAETEELNVLTLQIAKETGRGIPVFVILTHQDKMDAKELAQKKEKLGNEIGVDQNVIFSIANGDSENDNKEDDPQKEEYVRSMMYKILLAAKVHMEASGSKGTCEIQ